MQHLSVNLLARHWSLPPATCLHLSPGVARNFSLGLAVWELSPASLRSTCKRGEISSLLLFQPPSMCANLGCLQGQRTNPCQTPDTAGSPLRQFDEDAVALSPPAQHGDLSIITCILLLCPVGHKPFPRAFSSGERAPSFPSGPPEPLQAGRAPAL